MSRDWKTTFDEVRPAVVAAAASRPPDHDTITELIASAEGMPGAEGAGLYAAVLDVWMKNDAPFRWARKASDALNACLKRHRRLDPADFLEYVVAVFGHTGYLKDYKAAKRLAKRAGRLDELRDVDEVLRDELPDIWITQALKRDEVAEAIECWWEYEDHPRIRQCADDLIAAVGDQVDILVSGRLSMVNYWIGRGGRRRYRRACRILWQLRGELERLGELEYWPVVLEDIEAQHGHRPALLDELEKAGLRRPSS